MSDEPAQQKIKEAGLTAWRTSLLAVATALVLVLYAGMAYLVYLDRVSSGPLVLFTGVLLGYLLRAVRDWV